MFPSILRCLWYTETVGNFSTHDHRRISLWWQIRHNDIDVVLDSFSPASSERELQASSLHTAADAFVVAFRIVREKERVASRGTSVILRRRLRIPLEVNHLPCDHFAISIFQSAARYPLNVEVVVDALAPTQLERFAVIPHLEGISIRGHVKFAVLPTEVICKYVHRFRVEVAVPMEFRNIVTFPYYFA